MFCNKRENPWKHLNLWRPGSQSCAIFSILKQAFPLIIFNSDFFVLFEIPANCASPNFQPISVDFHLIRGPGTKNFKSGITEQATSEENWMKIEPHNNSLQNRKNNFMQNYTGQVLYKLVYFCLDFCIMSQFGVERNLKYLTQNKNKNNTFSQELMGMGKLEGRKSLLPFSRTKGSLLELSSQLRLADN